MAHVLIHRSERPIPGARWFAQVSHGAHKNCPEYYEAHKWFHRKADAEEWAYHEAARQDAGYQPPAYDPLHTAHRRRERFDP